MTESRCFLCDRGPNWYDRPILETEDGTISPALGAFVEGYVLVAPYRHVHAIADLEPPELLGFTSLVELAFAFVRVEYGLCVGWEHGGTAAAIPQSSCVRHAHLNLMPKIVDLKAPAPVVGVASSFARAFACVPPRPYLLLLSDSGSVTISEDVPRSQFFRREIAEAIGRVNEWDYLLYPNLDAVRRTAQALSARVAGVRSV